MSRKYATIKQTLAVVADFKNSWEKFEMDKTQGWRSTMKESIVFMPIYIIDILVQVRKVFPNSVVRKFENLDECISIYSTFVFWIF